MASAGGSTVSEATGSNEPGTWGARLWSRARRTGDSDPTVVVVIVFIWAVLVPLVLTPAILAGALYAAIGLVGFSAVLGLLPSLFRPEHGTAAALCRLAGLVSALGAVVAIGVYLWA